MNKHLLLLLALVLTSVNAFSLDFYSAKVVISPEGAGTVTPMSYPSVLANQSRKFTATANAGYAFEGWYIDGVLVSAENPYSHVFTANVTITAQFKLAASNTVKGFVLAGCEGMGTVSVSPSGTAVEGGYQYNHGTELTLTATANKGYQFDKWENSDGQTLSSNAVYQFTVNEDCAVYGVFSKMEGYQEGLVAFPGAEGYGRFTTGGRMIDGRGAKIYYVTRLDDCSDDNLVEGTLRWALKSGDDTPRTVLFKVSGTIYLTSRLTSPKPNCTIAGQTAPGGGICIAGYQMKLSSNTIVRHIRFRAGDLPNKSMSQLDVENINNVVLDHCTFAWSMEENLTMYDTDYTTVQWCLFSEPLYDSRNSKGNRAYGAQWGGEHSTLHHCLFAHCNSRSPRFNGVRSSVNDRQVDSEFINNVIFNWGNHNSLYGGECSAGGGTDYNRVYMINNYYKPGPATQNGANGTRYFVRPSGGSISEAGEWYLSGNKFETGSKWRGSNNDLWADNILASVNADNYWGYLEQKKGRAIEFWSMKPSQELYDQKLLKSLPEGYTLTLSSYDTADEAYQKVIRQAGASLPRYDEVDARILQEAAGEVDPQFGGARGARMGVIDTPYDITLNDHDVFAALYEGDNAADNEERDVTCYPRLQMDGDDCRVQDADSDGLPDAYETAVGLNPNDPSDGMKLTSSGYSNLEVFLNGVADGQIDARQYTKHQPATGTFTGFHAIVGEGEQYTTVQAAVDAAPADATPYYILVKKGIYEGHVKISRANVHITGQNKMNTIISWNKTHNEDGGNVETNATVNVTADNVSFDNLTIRNTRWNAGQALALYTKADRISITSCNLEGYQDTYRTGKRGQRHIVRNSKIAGRTDFIYNDGEVFFDSDTLHIVESGGYIIAPAHITPNYGYVFRNAVITAASAGMQTYLGRPWADTPKASFINTRLTEGVSIYPQGWVDMGGLPIQMAECNTMDANGNAVDLSQRKTSFTAEGTTRTSKALLGKVEADSYQLDYMLRGNDEWDADWQAFILPAPAVSVTQTTVSWTDRTGFARCFLVTVDGVATVTTATSRPNDGKAVTIRAISPFGVLGVEGSSVNPTSVGAIDKSAPVVHRSYFTPDGRQHQRLQHGVNIIRETYSDGTSRNVKIVAK